MYKTIVVHVDGSPQQESRLRAAARLANDYDAHLVGSAATGISWLDYMKVNGHDQSTRAYVGAFNFKGQDQQKNVGKLSGGERNRVNIAKMLKRGGNVLLLDEPTNDLDVETLGALEEAIENFAGCAVVISHDRFFLDRLATHILAFEGDSHVEWFEGNFAAYEEDKVRRLGEEATRPHRTTYRKLTR
jgi:ATPase subunit of ABC transporter with duplicated ATPase domains